MRCCWPPNAAWFAPVHEGRSGVHAKGFFDLQLEFAEMVSALSGLPFARTVLEYTNFYIRFGFGRDFDPTHSRWREYLAGLLDTDDRQDWTYRFYMQQSHTVEIGRASCRERV